MTEKMLPIAVPHAQAAPRSETLAPYLQSWLKLQLEASPGLEETRPLGAQTEVLPSYNDGVWAHLRASAHHVLDDKGQAKGHKHVPRRRDQLFYLRRRSSERRSRKTFTRRRGNNAYRLQPAHQAPQPLQVKGIL